MHAEVWDEKDFTSPRELVLVDAWDDFKMSASNIMRCIFSKTKLPSLNPPELIRNT